MGIETLEGTGMIRSNFVVLGLIFTLSLGDAWDANITLGHEPSAAEQTDPQSARGDLVLVVGASGTQEYQAEFASWAKAWIDAAGRANYSVTSIGTSDQSTDDREQLKAAIDRASDQDSRPLWIVLIGHGTFAREVAKFNLKGPDVSATELSEWLDEVTRPTVIANTASASGPFINRLSKPGRVVVTATKSGTEQNYARFGKFFAEAIGSADSDLDHDDEVSVQEAFLKASKQAQQFYDDADRIATEHALIDDNGDGKGTPAKMFRGVRAIGKSKDGSPLDGRDASRRTLVPIGQTVVLDAKERVIRDQTEAELDQLRSKKDAMTEDAYLSALEPLMLRLARLYRAAEKASKEATETPPAKGNQPDESTIVK